MGAPVPVTVVLLPVLEGVELLPRTPPVGPFGGATLAGAILAAAVKAARVLLLLLFLFVRQIGFIKEVHLAG